MTADGLILQLQVSKIEALCHLYVAVGLGRNNPVEPPHTDYPHFPLIIILL